MSGVRHPANIIMDTSHNLQSGKKAAQLTEKISVRTPPCSILSFECWCSFLFSLDGVFLWIRWIGKGVDWPIHQNKSYYSWLDSPNSIKNTKVQKLHRAPKDQKLKYQKIKKSVKVNLPFFTLIGKDWTRFAPNIRCTYNFDHFLQFSNKIRSSIYFTKIVILVHCAT